MELVIQVLMLFIGINTLLKLSFWKWWQTVIFGFVCAVFIVYSYPIAILQSKTQLVDYLGNGTIMQNIAVLVTLEAVLCFTYCFTAMQKTFGEKTSKWVRLLYVYPSLLLFPVLFYLLTQLIFALPGTDFTTISYLLAGGVFVGIPAISFLLKWLCPETELRLEVYFLMSLFVCVIGLITTVNGNVTYVATQEPLNIKGILLSIGLFVVSFIIGMVGNKIKWIIKSKNK